MSRWRLLSRFTEACNRTNNWSVLIQLTATSILTSLLPCLRLHYQELLPRNVLPVSTVSFQRLTVDNSVIAMITMDSASVRQAGVESTALHLVRIDDIYYSQNFSSTYFRWLYFHCTECDSLADGEHRHLWPEGGECQCKEGWDGINCNGTFKSLAGLVLHTLNTHLKSARPTSHARTFPFQEVTSCSRTTRTSRLTWHATREGIWYMLIIKSAM